MGDRIRTGDPVLGKHRRRGAFREFRDEVGGFISRISRQRWTRSWLADGDGAGDLGAPLLGHGVVDVPAGGPPRPQVLLQFPREHAAGLYEQGPVDRLVRHPHPVLDPLAFERPRDLLGRPVFAQAGGHVRAQCRVHGKQAPLRTPGSPPRAIVGVHRTVLSPAPVAVDLTAHRRRRTPKRACDPPHRITASEPARNLFALEQGQRPRATPSRWRDVPTSLPDHREDRAGRMPDRPSDLAERLS